MQIVRELATSGSLWLVLIALVVGCVCGLIGVRLSHPDRTLLATVFAPVAAIVAAFIYLVTADVVYGPHSDPRFLFVLVQSLARGCGVLPGLVILCSPPSIVGAVLTQCAIRTRLAHRG